MAIDRLLAALLDAPSLQTPRRLERGAVLPHGHLDLERIGPDAPALLAALARHPLPLRGLWLADNGLGSAATSVLVELLAAHPGLVQLDLSRNGLDLAALGPALRAHPGLRWLALTDNPPAPADEWSAWLASDPPLHGLSLAVHDPAPLLAALTTNTRLCRLDLGAALPPAALAHLCDNANRVRARPRLLALLRDALPAPLATPPPLPRGLDPADLDACARVLSILSRETGLLNAPHPRLAALRTILHDLQRGERREVRRVAHRQRSLKDQRRREDRERTARSAIRQRVLGVATGPEPPPDPTHHELHTPRACYVCKQPYRGLHFFYDRLCPTCAAENYARRHDVIDLRGRHALVTGGRIKIGHQVALRLLGWGAHVIVTSRFARDTVRRFAEHPDFASFRERLHVYSLDLRAIPRVELFAAHVAATVPRLDILVNNAAQTIARPPAFHAALLAAEAHAALPPALGALLPVVPDAPTTLPAESELFPQGSDDGFGQPLDLRASNSWRMRLDEVGTVELLEVQLINAVAPFVLNARLRAALARSGEPAFIVNVSAPEGRFDRDWKAPYHPHTNMAKAALNMMTRTSAGDYARDRIYMNSVDTGWASNENPAPIAAAMRDSGFSPPLDMQDAAARVCDPIVRGLRDGEFLSGLFLKDYRPITW